MEARDDDPQQTQQSHTKERVVEPQPAACIKNHQNTCSVEHTFGRKVAARYKRITTPAQVSSDAPQRRRRASGGVAARRRRILTDGVVVAPLMVTLIWLTAGCLPDPQRVQMAGLLDQLASARAMLGEQPPQTEAACEMIGSVQTRVWGEPGLVAVQPAWAALRDAASALIAVCGQSKMLEQPTNESLALTQARQRWERGIQREIGLACDQLRRAAAALDRAQPC